MVNKHFRNIVRGISAKGAGSFAAYKQSKGRTLGGKLNRKTRSKKRRGKTSKKSRKRKPNSMSTHGQGEHGVEEKSAVLYRTPACRKPHNLHGMQKWRMAQTHRAIMNSTAGIQGITEMFAVGTSDQAVISSGAGYGYFQGFVAQKDLNPYQKTTGSALWTAAAAVPKTDQWMLLEHDVMIEITNTGNTTMIGDLYVSQLKKDTEDGWTGLWAEGYSNAAFAVSEPAAVQPTTPAIAGTSGYPDVTMVGTRPNESGKFREYYKVVKCFHYELCPGATEVFKVRIVQNKLENLEYLTEAQGKGLHFIHSQTFFFAHVQRGQVVVDKTLAPVVAVNEPTYAQTQACFIANVKTQLCGIMGNAQRTTINDVITNVPKNALSTLQAFINDVDVATVAAFIA